MNNWKNKINLFDQELINEKINTDYFLCNLDHYSKYVKVKNSKLKLQNISNYQIKKFSSFGVNNGYDLLNILCLFQQINLHIKKTHTYKPFVQFINSIRSIDKDDCVQSNVYLARMFQDTIFILKESIDKRHNIDILREFFIGMYYVNTLKFIIPNFLFTYSFFKCSHPTIENNKVVLKKFCKSNKRTNNYILYEHIKGNTFANELENNRITLFQFKNLLVQLLLALEIAQNKIGFCHYDLHLENIMITPNKSSYSCNINDKNYKIHSNKYILTIIDYGNSSVKYRYKNKNRYISNVSMTNIGYFPFLIPGFDMYKFLCLSYMYCENYNTKYFNNIRNFLQIIFDRFYEKNPYNFSNLREKYDYGKKISYSIVANKTPIMLLDFLQKNKLTAGLKVTTRSYFKFYKQLYTNVYDSNQIMNNLKKFFSSYSLTNSFIANKWIYYIIKEFIKKYNLENSEILTDYIDSTLILDENLIDNDELDISKIKVYLNYIQKFIKKHKSILNKTLKEDVSILNFSKFKFRLRIFYSKFKPSTYIEFKLIIRNIKRLFRKVYIYKQLRDLKQIKKNNTFETFVKSELYKNYNSYIIKIDQFSKWIETHLNYLFFVCQKRRYKSLLYVFKKYNLITI